MRWPARISQPIRGASHGLAGHRGTAQRFKADLERQGLVRGLVLMAAEGPGTLPATPPGLCGQRHGTATPSAKAEGTEPAALRLRRRGYAMPRHPWLASHAANLRNLIAWKSLTSPPARNVV